MITPSFGLTATERVLPRLALDFTTATLDSRITFTRTTSASNPATYIDNSGAITSATNNQPRFDYDPVTLVCKGLLIEESRTNSLLNTDLLSTQIVTVTAAVQTLSFYGTGSVTLSGTHTAIVSGTGAYPTRTTYTFTPTAGALTLTVSGTVQYAQLELGAFATSYIPTTSAALTRNADVATMTGTNFSSWFTTNGTVYCEMTPIGINTKLSLYFYDGISSGESAYLYNATNVLYFRARSGGSTQATLNAGANSFVVGQTVKAVAGWKNSDFGLARDGNAASTTTSGTVSTAITQLAIGETGVNNYYRKIMFWPQKLTTNEIRAFSK